MKDRTTPLLSNTAAPPGHEFLTDRETELQARLDELEKDLADLGDEPGSIQDLEQQVESGLRALLDILEPSRPTPAPSPPPEEAPPPVLDAQPVGSGGGRRIAAVAALLLATLGAVALLLWYGLPLATGMMQARPTATTVALVPSTNTPTPTLRPTRPPATATPFPTPAIIAPMISAPKRTAATAQAETLQLLDISGTLRLELPLTPMPETVRRGEGPPLLQAVLPTDGAGLHRGSAPFGPEGTTIIAVPKTTAPAHLWQTRPGERLSGCNNDGACYDYRVVLAETWEQGRVQRVLNQWPPDWGVLLYVVLDGTDAWVVQAQPQEGERR